MALKDCYQMGELYSIEEILEGQVISNKLNLENG
jgi:hypothetical protein